ncbi:UNVERIFIED_ORG: anti-anti-sigma factor [Microbispora rosea subsp. rosea]
MIPPASPAFDIRSRYEREWAILTVTGDLDRTTAEKLKSVARTVWKTDPTRLVLDLSAVPFCDSAGLSALVYVLRGCQALDIGLALVGIEPRVERILSLRHLLSAFDRYHSVEEALDADGDGQPFGSSLSRRGPALSGEGRTSFLVVSSGRGSVKHRNRPPYVVRVRGGRPTGRR